MILCNLKVNIWLDIRIIISYKTKLTKKGSVFIEVASKNDRLYFESRIVSTVSSCKECQPSSAWIGLSSPKEKIKESGLWQVNELYKESLTESELLRLEELSNE